MQLVAVASTYFALADCVMRRSRLFLWYARCSSCPLLQPHAVQYGIRLHLLHAIHEKQLLVVHLWLCLVLYCIFVTTLHK